MESLDEMLAADDKALAQLTRPSVEAIGHLEFSGHLAALVARLYRASGARFPTADAHLSRLRHEIVNAINRLEGYSREVSGSPLDG